MFSEWACAPRLITRREMNIIVNNWIFIASFSLYMGDDAEVVGFDDPRVLHETINQAVGD